ncbi:hypothetical protein K438DRAFT_2093072, partial [Mycena galopus ATCC 62051]
TKSCRVQLTFLIGISRATFDTFCEILGRNPLFTSRERKPQRHIVWQLGAFLIRYGQLSSPVQDTSFKLGIGFGTVILYCRRIIRALCEVKPQYVQWFSEEHQLATSAGIEAESAVLAVAMAHCFRPQSSPVGWVLLISLAKVFLHMQYSPLSIVNCGLAPGILGGLAV